MTKPHTDKQSLIVGLGNPGEEYERTRHNAGRRVLELIAERDEFASWEKDRFCNSLVSHGQLSGVPVEFLLPETYMNKSGAAVKKHIEKVREITTLIVVHDDIDLPIGAMKISVGKGNGGHNGVDSIIKNLGTKQFIRVRIGICPVKRGTVEPRKPSGKDEVHDFVLGQFKKPERVIIASVAQNAEQALGALVTEGVEHAMNQFN